jgi:hypothetical protein
MTKDTIALLQDAIAMTKDAIALLQDAIAMTKDAIAGAKGVCLVLASLFQCNIREMAAVALSVLPLARAWHTTAWAASVVVPVRRTSSASASPPTWSDTSSSQRSIASPGSQDSGGERVRRLSFLSRAVYRRRW